MIVKRDKAYAKKHRNTNKFYRNNVALEINIEKKQYYETKVKLANSSNPRLWWKNVISLCNLKSSQSFTLSDLETLQPLAETELADLINSHFSALTSEYPELEEKWLSFENGALLPLVSTESVISRLKNIKCNKASGPFDNFKKYLIAAVIVNYIVF